jgi:phage gp36-like protein
LKLVCDEELSFSVLHLEPAQHQEDLDAAQSLWQYSTRSTSMDYNYRYTETQDGKADLQRTVEVRQDSVTDVYAQFFVGDQEVDDPADFPTVQGLFDKIQEAIHDEVTELAVIYDGSYGYPVEISILQDASKVIIKVDRMALYTIAKLELDDAMERWDELELTDYDYAVQVFCYCPEDYVRPKLVEVRDGAIASVTFLETDDVYSEIEQVQTVDSTFTRIRNAITDYAAIIDVTYHAAYGYPLEVFIDLDSRFADDDISIQFLDFSPLRFTAEEDALVMAMVLWSLHHLDRYSFGYQNNCFCLQAYRDPVLVQVQDATVTSVVSRYGDPVLESVAELVPSIEEIFAVIQEAITLNVHSILVTYHEVYGYPTSVYIDYDERLADEELSITVDYFAPITEWQSDLDTAKSSWQEAGLITYTYVYQRSCFCLPIDTAPKVVDIVDGVVVSVDCQPAQAVHCSGNDDNIPTIEGLFEEIQLAIESSAFLVDVQYDDELGYPLSIYIDYEEFIADEELIISATLPIGPFPPVPPLPDQQYFNLALSNHDDLCIGLDRSSARIGSTLKLMQCDTSSLR